MLLPHLGKRELVRQEAGVKDRRVMRMTLTDDGGTLLMRVLKTYGALIEKAMSLSTAEQCDLIGATYCASLTACRNSRSGCFPGGPPAPRCFRIFH